MKNSLIHKQKRMQTHSITFRYTLPEKRKALQTIRKQLDIDYVVRTDDKSCAFLGSAGSTPLTHTYKHTYKYVCMHCQSSQVCCFFIFAGLCQHIE